jgi:hypothetical protein
MLERAASTSAGDLPWRASPTEIILLEIWTPVEGDLQTIRRCRRGFRHQIGKPSSNVYPESEGFAPDFSSSVDKTIDVSTEQVTTSVIQLITTYIAMHTGG